VAVAGENALALVAGGLSPEAQAGLQDRFLKLLRTVLGIEPRGMGMACYPADGARAEALLERAFARLEERER
jgi:hypothetical protein